MSYDVLVNVDNPDARLTQYGAGAKVRLEGAATEGGSYTELSTQAISAGVGQYAFTDSTGLYTWYRSRVSTATPTVPGDYSTYSPAWQAEALRAYATQDDLLERLGLPDTSKYNLLADLLVGASAYLDTRIGFDFYRHPQVSGTETRTFDVSKRTGRLRVFGGLISADTVSMATVTGDTLQLLDTTDWFLHPRTLEPEGTYTHVELFRFGSFHRFYTGQGVVSVTGAFGWPAVPTIIKEATLAYAVRSYHQNQTKDSGIVGVPEFGTATLGPNLPDVTYRAIENYRRYFWAGV